VTTKQTKTSIERVKAALVAAGEKGLTLNGLIDEVNVVNGEKVAQDDYLAKGPVMGALAEMADQWIVEGDGDGALYKLKAPDVGAASTSADMLTPSEIMLARITLARKIIDGEHHAWKGTPDQQALVNAGLAEVKTAEGGAQSLVLSEGAALRISMEGLRVWLLPTVPAVELGEPREDVLVRRAELIGRIFDGSVQVPKEFSNDLRELITAGAIEVKEAEGGAVFALTENAEKLRPFFGYRGIAEKSLPSPPPAASPSLPITSSPEYKAMAKSLEDLKKEITSSRAIEKALRQKLEEAVPSTKPRARFTYTNQWTVKAGKPETKLAMMGRGLELSKLLQREIQRAKNVVDGAKARYEQVQKNLGPRIVELQSLENLMTWEESVTNCTAHILGQTVFVRDEYENNIAKFPVTDCPEAILAIAERVDDESKEEAKQKPSEQKTEKPKASSDATNDDAKATKAEPGKKGVQLTIGESGEKDAEEGDNGSGVGAASADAKQHFSFAISVEGFQTAIAHVLDEKGYVFEDELKSAIESASGMTIPDSAKTFMDAALDAMKSRKEIKADQLDGRAALMRVGEPKVGGKQVASSGGKVGAKVMKKVLEACKRIAVDKANVTIKLQQLVDASTCSANEVELAMGKAVENGDATAKAGKSKAWIWKGAAK
jgi:hypothetical protein